MLKIKVLDSKRYSRLKELFTSVQLQSQFSNLLIPRQKGSSSLVSSFKEYTFCSSRQVICLGEVRSTAAGLVHSAQGLFCRMCWVLTRILESQM